MWGWGKNVQLCMCFVGVYHVCAFVCDAEKDKRIKKITLVSHAYRNSCLKYYTENFNIFI